MSWNAIAATTIKIEFSRAVGAPVRTRWGWRRFRHRNGATAPRLSLEPTANKLKAISFALDRIRRGDRLPDGPIDACVVCFYARLGDVFYRARMNDSAVVMYEQYVNTINAGRIIEDHWNLPRILNRLGELYEARGDRAKAIDYYSRFVELWKHADPELQPRVSAVRQRLTKLKNASN